MGERRGKKTPQLTQASVQINGIDSRETYLPCCVWSSAITKHLTANICVLSPVTKSSQKAPALLQHCLYALGQNDAAIYKNQGQKHQGIPIQPHSTQITKFSPAS